MPRRNLRDTCRVQQICIDSTLCLACPLQWVLSIEPESGWDVVWKGPAIVAVVVISVFLSLLLLMLLISR